MRGSNGNFPEQIKKGDLWEELQPVGREITVIYMI